MSSKNKTATKREEAKPALVPKLRFPEFQNAGDWTAEVLRAVATIRTEKVGNNICVPMSITSGVGLVSQEDKFGRVIAGDSYKNYLLLKPNEFAYNKSATKEYPEGFLTLYSGTELAAVPNSIFTCFRINGDSPDVRFLNYQFSDNLHGRWLRKFIQVGARANGSLSINDNDLMALPVPIPTGTTSVAEQQKIAECLSSVNELIAAQAAKVDALKTHKKGLMQQLFPRKGEAQPGLRFPEFQNAGEWEDRHLGDYFDPIRNGFVGTATPYYTTSDGIRYLQGRNIKQGRIEAENIIFITSEFHNRQRKSHLKIGDILMVQSGHVGECAVVGPDFAGANCHALVILTPKRKLSSEFFAHYFYSPIGKLAIFKITTGNTIKHILASELKTLPVLVPSLAEQQRIASCLSNLDAWISVEAQKLEAFKTHKKGLMQQLFPSPEEVDA
ncbi:restriction endonuclease subunit S [Ralstonia solanacearum]|uniref:Restriction endonuclease subunit S n=1 Tax=Ralstonia solanacearum TaxID=305 RepID=A0AAW5ZTK6_RALSL|nr:restriction endonuclease subunit S [Ralstonia solanacearum]MDB0573096.1 restriction endonuclease subunit S [Ralstonia solanacearum]